jgi:hypothetical protein
MLKSLVVMLVLPAVASAAIVNIDLCLDFDQGGLQDGPGAVGAVGDVWNWVCLPGGWGALVPDEVTGLVDSTGAATSVSLKMNNGQYRGPVGSGWTGPLAAMYQDGIHFYADETGAIGGLNDGSTYDIYLYGGPWDGNGTVFTVDGVAKSIQTSNSWESLAEIKEGEEYALFSGVAPVGGEIGFTVGLAPDTNAWLTGIQIVEVPEPATMLMLGVGVLFLRKKK